MTEMDYTFDRQIMLEREDAYAEGEVMCRINQMVKKVKKNLDDATIADQLESDPAEIARIRKAIEAAGTEDTDAIYKKYLERK